MASSSSSASNSQYSPRWKYDVFLSFRGEDTRKKFTGHLYKGLEARGIITFQDDKRLEYGDSISEELLTAIEESQVALIIFSEHYATSSWCLNELVKIMECKDKNGQTVIPIFYDVDASHVRKQTESFAVAFAEHEKQYEADVEGMQKVKGWRTALTAAADLKGSVVFHGGVESDCIEHIIAKISSICKSSVSYLHKVVGVDSQLKKVESLLEMEIDDVRIVWIWGMGGVGKTTIAKSIFYNTLSSKFKDACFLEDIKENNHRIQSLQNILLSKLVGEKENCVNDKEEGRNLLACRLRSKKVLVVLDDIDHRDQLDYLAGDLGWFGKGSRIIATTRDKHLMGNKDIVYEVTTLVDNQAIQLFNQYAFEGEVPDERFDKLTLEVVSHAKGLPLALKVWGSFLRNRGIKEWRSAIEDMRINSKSEIHGKLKISYDGLETAQQDIFLDIACFLRGKDKDYIMQILESCHSGANIGLSVLIDKSLVFLTEDYRIQMHDLIQEMGKYVVNLQKDPGERSRLWFVEDFKEMMFDNTGTKAMEAIWLEYIRDLCFKKKAMKNMKRLRILHINGVQSHSDSIEYLPNSLRWFDYYNYPWKSLPENFEPKKLVHLDLSWSSLHHLWIGKKHFPCLRKLDLTGSNYLMRTPDFREMPNLEYLNLWCCMSLEEVDDSLGYCGKLIKCDLSGCASLKRFPCVNLESLEYLDLGRCSSLEKFPEIRGRMKPELVIEMVTSGIRELPSSFFQSGTHLTKLYLSYMQHLVALPSSIGMLKSLVELNASCCSKLESLPEEIGDLENLEKLDASGTLISRPPSSIVRLNKLKFLSFEKKDSEVEVCFVFPSVADGLRSLEILNLNNCNLINGGLPEDIGSLSSLKELNLNGNNFEQLPRSIAQLGALQSLKLSDCKRLKELPGFMGMPNLETLNLSNCTNLEKVHYSLEYCRKLIQLELANCSSLKRLPCVNLESLEYLNLTGCSSSEKFPEIKGRRKLGLEIEMNYSGIREIPSSFFQYVAHLTKLDLSFMKNLVALPRGIGMLKSLVELNVSDCSSLEILPEEIGDLENLEKLDARGTLISHPPSSIARLNKLKFLRFEGKKSEVGVCFVLPSVAKGLRSLEILNLNNCNLINRGLPEDIGSLSSLKELNLNGNNFDQLPRSIAQLGALQSLKLSDCKRLKELPGFMGMPNLETLNLSNCTNLEEVHHSLGFLQNLCTLRLTNCKWLKRLPALCIVSLESLDLKGCSSLENIPEILGSMNLELASGIPSSICKLKSLVKLNVSHCSKLASLPEDIGSLSSLKELNLSGNNFEHLPRSIAQLGALQILDVSDCTRLTQLPKFPQQLDKIYVDWSNDSICNSLFQNILSLQHDISASDSLSLRVFTVGTNIPSWFHHQGISRSVSINLPENRYIGDNFLGFVVCYSGRLIDTTAYLIPLCNRMSWTTRKLALSNHSKFDTESTHLFLVPFASLWDASKVNGKTPNDYAFIGLTFSGEIKKYGFRLLYKDEPKLEALLQMRENNVEPTEDRIMTRRSRYDDSEASSSSRKKQKSHSNIHGSSVFENLQQQVEAPISLETLQLFPTSPRL